MKIIHTTLLLIVLTGTGCEFSRWATTADPETRKIPAVEAGKEVIGDTFTGFETGGLLAGIAALVFTTTKTGMRLYADYQNAKKK